MKVRILGTGDLHFGHSRVPTELMCDRLVNTLFPYLEKTDLLAICGDVFHCAMNMANVDAKIVIAFFIKLMDEAAKHGVVVRLLRGTFSHDRHQIKIIEAIHKESKYTNDLKYFDSLTLEYIEALDLRVVYIPEDIPYKSSDEIIKQVELMMSQSGWDICNLVMYHGYFEHMLPPGMPHMPKITFKASQFNEILSKDGYVLANHVHTKSSYMNILGIGSFDRLAHGEEETKGFVYIDETPEFIVNRDATLSCTIDIDSYTDKDSAIVEYKKQINHKFKSKQPGFVRVIHNNIEIRQILATITALNYPYLTYSHKAAKSHTYEKLMNKPIIVDTSLDTIVTEQNLPNLICQFLSEKNIIGINESEIANLLQQGT